MKCFKRGIVLLYRSTGYKTASLQSWSIFSGNDIRVEGVYEMEDGTEMEWVSSNWCNYNGADYDALLFGTYSDSNAGCWNDEPIGYAFRYICEKNE